MGSNLFSVPETFVQAVADLGTHEYHSDNGPGDVYCNACGASCSMRWHMGRRLHSQEVIKHEHGCISVRAQNMLSR